MLKIYKRIFTIEEYKVASNPCKHNTIFDSKDESFLKDIYAIETNSEWRRMCIKGIHDEAFLEYAAKKDTNERVRREAARNSKKDSLIIWLRVYEHSPLVREYVEERYSKMAHSLKFILE